MILQDRITRLRGVPTAGSYGSPDELDWTTPGEAQMPAEVYGPTSAEDVSRAQQVEAQYVVQTYGGADVTAVDRVTWQGDTYEVAGGVDKLSIHGSVLSLRFFIKRVTGG